MSDRIPSEFIGRARAFRNRVATAEDRCFAEHEVVYNAFRQRMRHKPSFRRPECLDLLRRWRSIEVFGRAPLDAVFNYTKRRVEITDFRMICVVSRGRDWAEDARESNVDLALVRLIAETGIEHGHVEQKVRSLASFSLHALARYYQRAFRPSDEALIDAMWGVMPSVLDIFHGDEQQFTIPVPDNGGNWWGRLVTGYRTDLDAPDWEGEAADVLDIRTFYTDCPRF
jgi:hypothetical protein